ncbi:class I SAM-dependent methyltransferase [Ralstonia soli]|uniref:Class I SAM-dependent methyltransferase n=1 Tax=Ralstonia soli TaxID=2953896 RepID=A0ABT1APB4_9RALS|nr:class I SAM-dependent methyltransferase [Ralstonia soli]MCO5400265.1 class I SAM-dependent methyltransferase [Ralstonia soli]
MNCRHCAAPLHLPLIDLGKAPPSNAYLEPAALARPESSYPLRVMVCEQCWLVQTEDFTRADEVFNADYAYFSAYSASWLKHAERYVADMCARFELNVHSLVAEVAANDGYLLQYVRARGIPCYGIEPTASTAAAARARGIDIIEAFFGMPLATALVEAGRQADLIAANNVLAHVPDINDFVRGFTALLKPQGVATFEFPQLRSLIEGAQFDTIYHEHFSYLSLTAVEHIFAANGLHVFDVQALPTHGGSLRVFAQRADTGQYPRAPVVDALLADELAAGMKDPAYYSGLQARAEQTRNGLVAWLTECRKAGLRVAGYGAAAKGNTLLNFAGITRELLPYVVDRNPAKQGRFLPGSRIPVKTEDTLSEDRPDVVVLLPWNLKDELAEQLAYVRKWGGRLAVAVPAVEWL